MNARLHGVAAAAALSLLTAPAVASQSAQTPVLLRIEPPEGQVSRYAWSMESEMDNPMMPLSGPLMTMRLFLTETVLGVSDEVIRYRVSFDSTTMSMAMPMPGMEMPDFSGSSMTFEIDSRGRTVGVASLAVLPEAAGFSPANIIEQFGRFVLPAEEVSPGASWTVDSPIDVPMGPAGSESVEVATTYTFDSLQGSLATISFEGPMEMEMDMAGMSITATGTMTGSTVVDLAEGRYRSLSTEVSLNMDMGAMTMTTTTTATLELLPDP